MKRRMTHATRAELTDAIRDRYRAAAGKEKRGILVEFIAATGYHEKSAIRALNAEPTTKQRQTRNRPSLYDDAVRAALIVPMGGLRSSLREALASAITNFVARVGTQRTFAFR